MPNEKKQDKPEIKDYSADERYNRRSALITALLKWLQCEFFGLFIFLSELGMSPLLGKAGSFIFGTFGLICYICVMADFGIKEGAKAHVKNTVRGDKVSRSYGLVLGAASAVPALISYLILALSYTGAIGSAVLPFKIMNLGLWGYIDIFAHTSDIANASSILLWLYPVLMLLYPLTTYITFKIGFDNEDLQTKIMYRH